MNVSDIMSQLSMLYAKQKNRIKSITSNPKKKITTVVFGNNNMQMSKCSENDDYDLNVGVAMCIAYEQFRSKNQFHKFVEKTAKIVKSKEKEV